MESIYIHKATIFECLQFYWLRNQNNHNELEPADSIIEDLGMFMTSYYPLVGVTIVLNSGDSLIAYCDGQGDLTIPWNLKHFNFKSFNPYINRALYAILPEEMNLNRKRLTTGISKK